MNFKETYELPIGGHVEKKGKFSYLSWSYAVKFLRENVPDAQWIIHENQDGLPYFAMTNGVMVKVSVVIDGVYFTQWHPVLNHQNKPIPTPNPFEINTSIQRCLTKAIGLATGIGLGLYAGEDLPIDTKTEKTEEPEHQQQQQKPKGPASNPQNVAMWVKWMSDNAKKGCTPDQLHKAFENNVTSKKNVFSEEDYAELLDYKNDLAKEIQQKG